MAHDARLGDLILGEGVREDQAMARCRRVLVVVLQLLPGLVAVRGDGDLGVVDGVVEAGRDDAEGAVIVCDRIRKRLEAKVWPTYPELGCTASFGIANIPSHEGGSARAWIEASDKALYAAKEAGRNRVEIYDPNANPGEFRNAS